MDSLVVPVPIIKVVYPIDDLGDLGYVDELYRVFSRTAATGDADVWHIVPSDLQKAMDVVSGFAQEQTCGVPHLYVISEGALEPELDALVDEATDDPMKTFLVWDSQYGSDKVSSLDISMFGVAYEAGYMASMMPQVDSLLILEANPYTKGLEDARNGFMEGYGDGGHIDVEYLSDERGGGFAMSAEVYRASYSYDGVDMVFPLCGGSTQGLLRYNREHPHNSFYTIGVDVDMSKYSSLVPFSCVKHTGKAVEMAVTQWMEGTLPLHQVVGLGDGFTQLVISPLYKDLLGDRLEEIHEHAVNREIEYEME